MGANACYVFLKVHKPFFVFIFGCRRFTSSLMEQSHALGMPILQEPVVEYQRRGQSPADVFSFLMRRVSNLQLIMAVLPKKGGGSGYGEYSINHH